MLEKVKEKIAKLKRGAVFTPASFGLLGSPSHIANALAKLVETGEIRKLSHGIYYFPKFDRNRREIPPDLHLVARCIAEKLQQTILISAEAAAFHYKLVAKPPEVITYLTDGPARTRHIGEYAIHFRRVTKKTLVGAGNTSGMVFQALRYFGKDGIENETIEKIRSALTEQDKRQILRDYRKTPIWMHNICKRIAT